jgi:L-lactate utilization protein LutC
MRHINLFLCLLVVVTATQAQTPETKPAPVAKTAGAKTAVSPEAELELKGRRAKARALLVALSSDARTFHDETLRARSLARIADALWQVDPEQGRLLFRKAWEAAEVADGESDKKLQEEIRQQKTRTGGGFAVNLPPNVQREVLRLAARHDRALGEEFLEKLRIQKLEAAASPLTNTSPNHLNEAMSQRLSVARELFENGEMERAVQFADPALSLVTMESMNFLSDVREKNAFAADTRYAALLAASTNNPQADANTVSLLSSYIFTPHLYVTFSNNGSSSSQQSSTITPAVVSPELRNAFFQTAAAILLRPLPAPGQPDQSSAGLDGKYLVIKRLLPFFEQSAPPAIVESLRGHMSALSTVVSDNARKYDDDSLNRGMRPERPATDREQSLLDRIDRAKTSAERDTLYLELAGLVGRTGDLRAREFVSKVEDTELRKQAQAYTDASLAMHFVEKKMTDQALDMVHKGDLTPLIKTWVLTQSAKLLAKTDKDKAQEVADEAATEARRLDVSDPNLPRALVAVANAFKAIDPARVWDATFDAVKAANSAEGFTGEDGEIVVKFQSKAGSSVHTNDVPDFDLEGIFKDLALQDYDRAVELARGFQGEGPRAVATIAIARAILEPKKK